MYSRDLAASFLFRFSLASIKQKAARSDKRRLNFASLLRGARRFCANLGPCARARMHSRAAARRRIIAVVAAAVVSCSSQLPPHAAPPASTLACAPMMVLRARNVTILCAFAPALLLAASTLTTPNGRALREFKPQLANRRQLHTGAAARA